MSGLWYATPDSWQLPDETDRRFNRIVGISLLLFVIVGIVIPYLKLQGLKEGGGDTTEQRYVSLIPDAEIAKQVEEPAPAPEDKPKPEQPKAETRKQDKPPEPKREEKVTPPQPTQEQVVQKARETASRSGILAMQQQLSELNSQSLQGFDAPRPLSRIEAQAGTGATGAGSSAAFERAAASGSSGIGASGSGEQRRQSGAGIGNRRTQVVDTPIGAGPDKTKPGQGGDKLMAGRTLEEIQLAFDRKKGTFSSIYRRAAMESESLAQGGKIIVSITIAPSGEVTDCRLVSSTFNDPDLERKIIQSVMSLRFEAKSVPPFTYPNYPIVLIPQT